jgi:hypothetical protein
MKIRSVLTVLTASSALSLTTQAQFLSEFEPNPAGIDPAESIFELGGTPSASFNLWILSIENDGLSGLVDRASNVSGTFDGNGLATVTVPDLENPSFTVILSSAFSGSAGDDLDLTDSGTLDVSGLGTIFDAVGVSDDAGDDPALYASTLGGTNILYNGEFEPLSVFRDPLSGDWFQTVTVDFGEPGERIGVFGASGAAGGEIPAGNFSFDPTATTLGTTNPTLVPEPSTYVAFIGLIGLGFALARRRKS